MDGRESYWFWLLLSLLFSACAVTSVEYISRESAGSGMPQLKAVLSGVTIDNFLSFRTYIAKVIGLICMLLSGLSLGKEGPFVHIAACIAEMLPFEEKQINKKLRH